MPPVNTPLDHPGVRALQSLMTPWPVPGGPTLTAQPGSSDAALLLGVGAVECGPRAGDTMARRTARRS